MADSKSTRKLASIVAVDVAGYSRRTEKDEAASIEAVAALSERITNSAGAHGGRVFNTAGDGFMLEFPSAASALAAAEEIAVAADPPVRVGVHLGDVSITPSGDLLGHGVNVAARIQQMASPGAVLASGDVKRAIRGLLAERLKPQGSVRLDKMSETLAVFALVPPQGGRAKGRRRNLKAPVVVAAGALILTLAGLSIWLARGDLLAAGGEPRVFVMPFDAPDRDVIAKQVSAGTADQLVDALSAGGIQSVRTPQADSAFRLNASVRTEGEKLRINARLADSHDGGVLWSKDFDGPSTQASALQEATAAAIATVVACAVQARRPQRGRPDNATLGIYLHACDEGRAWTVSLASLAQLIELDREIVRRAPHFSAAQSNLASEIVNTVEWFPPNQQPDLLAEARARAQSAQEDDRNNGEAYAVQALLEPHGAWATRERLLLKGLAVEPTSDEINADYFTFLVEVGRLKEAAVYAQRAAALAPLDADRSANAAESLALIGETEHATATLQAAKLRWPDSVNVNGQLLQLSIFHGAEDEQDAVLNDVNVPLSGPDKATWRKVLKAIRSGNPRLAASVKPSVIEMARNGDVGRRYAVMMLSAMGLLDDAFAVAPDLAAAPPLPIVTGALYAPLTSAMRRDPRFMQLASDLGLANYWRETGKWPDFCSEPDLPYNCKSEAAKFAQRLVG